MYSNVIKLRKLDIIKYQNYKFKSMVDHPKVGV